MFLFLAYTSNADMIQPGLTPLQPSMDDFMDIPGSLLSSHPSISVYFFKQDLCTLSEKNNLTARIIPTTDVFNNVPLFFPRS